MHLFLRMLIHAHAQEKVKDEIHKHWSISNNDDSAFVYSWWHFERILLVFCNNIRELSLFKGKVYIYHEFKCIPGKFNEFFKNFSFASSNLNCWVGECSISTWLLWWAWLRIWLTTVWPRTSCGLCGPIVPEKALPGSATCWGRL